MSVVENARLIERRLEALRARRDRLPRTRALPPWAAEALLHAGMARHEIESFDAATAPFADPAAAERARLDDAIETLEGDLMLRGDDTLANLKALAELALARLRRASPSEPRALELVERVADGLQRLGTEPVRQAG